MLKLDTGDVGKLSENVLRNVTETTLTAFYEVLQEVLDLQVRPFLNIHELEELCRLDHLLRVRAGRGVENPQTDVLIVALYCPSDSAGQVRAVDRAVNRIDYRPR